MDFNKFFVHLFSSILIFFKRVFYLLLSPYKCMRDISQDEDMTQVFIIFFLVGFYFQWANEVKQYHYEPVILFALTIFHYLLTVCYFMLLKTISSKYKSVNVKKFLLVFSYSLIPTLIWFFVNTLLYILIPPPRTPSFLGQTFSLVYISFSVAIFAWKIIMVYLAARFTTGFRFFRIIYSLLLYTAIVIPYSVLLYKIGIFRVPFL